MISFCLNNVTCNASIPLEMTRGAVCSSSSLPKKLLEYITEVQRRSGVKLDIARTHAANIDAEQKQGLDENKEEEMDSFTRPRSKSGFQVTSPLAITQRRTVAEVVQQRPKSAYLLNGHCELNLSAKEAREAGYHTDGEDNHHQLKIPDHQKYMRRRRKSPVNDDDILDVRLSSASTICSSEDEDNDNTVWLNFCKGQNDIGTTPVEQNNELLEKIKMLEKQNEMLKQQLEERTVKDEAIQVQQYSAVMSMCVHVSTYV